MVSELSFFHLWHCQNSTATPDLCCSCLQPSKIQSEQRMESHRNNTQWSLDYFFISHWLGSLRKGKSTVTPDLCCSCLQDSKREWKENGEPSQQSSAILIFYHLCHGQRSMSMGNSTTTPDLCCSCFQDSRNEQRMENIRGNRQWSWFFFIFGTVGIAPRLLIRAVHAFNTQKGQDMCVSCGLITGMIVSQVVSKSVFSKPEAQPWSHSNDETDGYACP
jgi:hypothetical protein